MPRTHALTEKDADQPRSKRQKLTSSQLERKRELDREAQRTIRERTKNHIAHLESLVEQLQGDQGGQVQRLVTQLNESRAEVNRLKDALNSIIKISTSVTGANPDQAINNASGDENVKQETSPVPPVIQQSQRKRSTKQRSATQSNTDQFATSNNSEREDFHADNQQESDTIHDHHTHFPHFDHNTDHAHPGPDEEEILGEPIEELVAAPDEEHDASINVNTDNMSVAQMAHSIVSNSKLEGRYWYLAGVLLTQILKKQQQGGFVNFADDEDIAIRAVFEGWSNVLERYPLDRGWQWLKELDETIYFHHFGPAERLMNLRNCRFMFLHQCYPDAGWNKRLPSFYLPHPSEQLLQVDPLVQHFPWPGFRKRLMYSPREFATNKFMDNLRRNLHFVWNHDPGMLYQRDPFSGQYLYSDLFIKHIMDIKCYSARPEFFINFPELGRDIPWNRNDFPSPYNRITHRFSLSSTDTSSTTHASPVQQSEEAEHETQRRDGNMDTTEFPHSHGWSLAINTHGPLSSAFGRELSGR